MKCKVIFKRPDNFPLILTLYKIDSVDSVTILSYILSIMDKNRDLDTSVISKKFPVEGNNVEDASIPLEDRVISKPPEKLASVEAYLEGPPSVNNFDKIRTIGVGYFGRVALVQHKRTGLFLAMKVVNKRKVVKEKYIKHAIYEKEVLQLLRSQYVVNLHYCFKDNCNLCYLLDYVPGGDLFTYMEKVHYLDEDHARFYISQMVLAVEYLHSNNIAYRDFKLENILLDHIGYCKLTDFGYAKKFTGRTWTLCGTPEYVAPEMILHRGYNHSVDWWSLGILAYEMVRGIPPFYGSSDDVIFKRIVECKASSKNECYHHSVCICLKDLLGRLIQVDLSKRIGNLKNGVTDIKDHVWFDKINWVALANKEVKAPYIPYCGNAGDSTNFDHFEEEDIEESDTELYAKEFEDF
ncbi:cAMP-dependent protein kinase catalytic subunit beta-like [Dysidea avara]|uniref:cAMP-dependent protein kinase catalytic subunit beta-like n=1 Tax=Dysidea avara TaxID=196820 RepID=UPI00331DE95D